MSFLDELKRRNVIRVAIAYIVVAWLTAQVAEFATENFGAPEWALKTFVIFLILGLPFVVIFAWAFEMTPDGIKREQNVSRSQSITAKTGKKLNLTIISALVLVAVYFIWESRFQTGDAEKGPDTFSQQAINQTTQIEEKMYPAPFQTDISKQSIAVLPFANRSKSEDDAFFTDGIHDDLLTQLAKISDLKVISRTSVMKYKGTERTIPEIASDLGVATILEGGIQRAGKRIRINAQLIDVSTDEHLWAETYDREMTMENIFDIQTEITRQIVTAVRGELSITEQQSLGAAPTSNLDAYEAYLHARGATSRADYSKEKYIEAQPWAERAVKLDPEFAEAWAILAEIHGQAVWLAYDNTPSRHAAAREALSNALRLDPDSAAVKAAQGEYFYRFENNYPAALAQYKAAHAIAPGDARILLYTAITLRRMGFWEEAIKTFEESMQLDPANLFTATQFVDTLIWMNEWDRVDSLFSEWLIKYPDSWDLKGMQVRAKLVAHGDLLAARQIFDLLKPWPGYVYTGAATSLLSFERNFDALLAIQDTPEFVQFTQYGNDTALVKGQVYHYMGDEDRARQYLQQQVDYSLAQEPTGTFVDGYELVNLASAWSYLGDHVRALETSEKAMQAVPLQKDHIFGAEIANIHTLLLARAGKRDEALKRLGDSVDRAMGLTRWELYLDPAWDFFRDDPRFNELATPLNLNRTRQ